MTATTIAPNTAAHQQEQIERSVQREEAPDSPSPPPAGGWTLAAQQGKLYRFHGFRVLDVYGERVGFIDWIWADDTGSVGAFLGVQLRWLRGTARAVPASEAQIDPQTSTVRLAWSKEQIKRAPRFSIDRHLTSDQKRSIRFHFRRETGAVSGRRVTEAMVA